MIWVDRIVKELQENKQHVDDMFTPSGIAHIGSLRGPILHDVVARTLSQNQKGTEFTYIFNDFDVIDGLPENLRETYEKYMGYSLRMAPSPDPTYNSFGEYFTEEMKSTLNLLGVKATYLSSWDMYHEGKFNDVIRIALDNKEKILEIYRKVAGYQKKSEDWFPLQVICPKCNKLGTTKVTGWNGKTVTFTCEPNLVTWAKGCGYTGEISPFDGNGKFPWKVDWPAHWKVLGVTFEGAGKDHASRGGSYDIAFEICEHVFSYPKPYYFPYEFFLFGGRKMSSSKGIGASSKDISQILPPAVFRFLIIRTQPERTIEFSPQGDAIPNLFDEYDRCLNAHFDKLENKLPEGKPGEVLSDLVRIIELSEIQPLPKKRLYLPRFRNIVNLIKTKADILLFFENQKGSKLNAEEKKILDERIKYANVYLERYTTDTDTALKLVEPSTQTLSAKEKLFLNQLVNKLKQVSSDQKEDIQNLVFETLKENNLQAKEVFKAFYRVLIGRDFGPKAADLILEFGKDKVIVNIQKSL